MFFYFSNYYALFAGISSALIGIKEVRDYIEDAFAKHHKIIVDQLEPHISEAQSLCLQYELIIESCVNDKDYQKVTEFITSLNGVKRRIKILQSRVIHIDIIDEIKTTSKKLSSLHIFVFLFSVVMLLVSASNEAKIISNSEAFIFIGNLEVLAFATLIGFILLINGNNRTSVLIISVICFGICFIASAFFTWGDFGFIYYNRLLTIGISIVICASPLIVLVCSSYLKWHYMAWQTNRMLSKGRKDLSEKSKKSTDYILIPPSKK